MASIFFFLLAALSSASLCPQLDTTAPESTEISRSFRVICSCLSGYFDKYKSGQELNISPSEALDALSFCFETIENGDIKPKDDFVAFMKHLKSLTAEAYESGEEDCSPLLEEATDQLWRADLMQASSYMQPSQCSRGAVVEHRNRPVSPQTEENLRDMGFAHVLDAVLGPDA